MKPLKVLGVIVAILAVLWLVPSGEETPVIPADVPTTAAPALDERAVFTAALCRERAITAEADAKFTPEQFAEHAAYSQAQIKISQAAVAAEFSISEDQLGRIVERAARDGWIATTTCP